MCVLIHLLSTLYVPAKVSPFYSFILHCVVVGLGGCHTAYRKLECKIMCHLICISVCSFFSLLLFSNEKSLYHLLGAVPFLLIYLSVKHDIHFHGKKIERKNKEETILSYVLCWLFIMMVITSLIILQTRVKTEREKNGKKIWLHLLYRVSVSIK